MYNLYLSIELFYKYAIQLNYINESFLCIF